MLKDEHLKVLQYFSNSMEVFPNTNINGGVAMTYWNKSGKYKPIGSFTPFDCLSSIKDKVTAYDFESFSEIVYPRDIYKFDICLTQLGV